MNRKRGLGRGLDALLGGVAMAGPAAPDESLAHLPVERLQRGRYQPRLHMDAEALSELAESIQTQGVVQPIVVRPAENGYEIIPFPASRLPEVCEPVAPVRSDAGDW